MEQWLVYILILIPVLSSVINGYSITYGRVENTNTFVETTVPLQTRVFGSKRDNIIAYSTDKKHLAVHVSHDSGLTFANKLDQFLLKFDQTSVPAYLDEIYISLSGQIIIFTDIIHDALFISTNFGHNFKLISVNFKPSLIEYYGNENRFVVFDDRSNTLYFTNNNGGDFVLIQKQVTSFQWQTFDGRNENLFFGFNSSIFIFNGFNNTIVIWDNVFGINYRQFQAIDGFIFVLTNQNNIYFAHKNGPLIKVGLYPYFKCEGFHVAAIEENSIKLAVVHKSETRLYVGNYRENPYFTIQFVLSLKSIVSHVPKITWNSTLIRIKNSFTELYSVDGLTGVYIANIHRHQLYSKVDLFSISDIRSVITLDNGATWKPFDAHFYDSSDNFIDCSTQCRLKLNTKLFEAIGLYHYQEMKSYNTILGLIVASGMGQSTSEPPIIQPYTFLSYDMGKSWQKILDGYYKLNIGNHGGIVVAVKSQGTTKELLYSFNYGGNWNSYIFYDIGITVFDLLTSDIHNSTAFQIVGYDGVRRRQMFINLEFRNIFVPNCPSSGITTWTSQEKIFGKNIILEHTIDRNCLNFKPIVTIADSECGNTDYECSYGYFRNNLTSTICQPRSIECKSRSFYTTGQLQKIEGNTCEDRLPKWGQNITCPIKDDEKYIFIANGTKIHRVNRSKNISSIQVRANTTIRAIDFDIITQCLFYSEFGTGQIECQCQDSVSNILVPETDTWYKSLSYDYIFKVLYYLDAQTNKLMAVHADKINWGKDIKMNDLLLIDPQFVYVNPEEHAIYVVDGKYIKRGTIIHVNGEISVQDFELQILRFKFKPGDTFTISKENKKFIINDWYTHEKGNIFKNTYKNVTIATGFTSLYDMRFVDMSRAKSPNKWLCESGEKISREMVCDGHFDCEYGDDESSCEIRYQPDKFYSSLRIQHNRN